jgi:hypothetical protein
MTFGALFCRTFVVEVGEDGFCGGGWRAFLGQVRVAHVILPDVLGDWTLTVIFWVFYTARCTIHSKAALSILPLVETSLDDS